jgi:hypothetical protein
METDLRSILKELKLSRLITQIMSLAETSIRFVTQNVKISDFQFDPNKDLGCRDSSPLVVGKENLDKYTRRGVVEKTFIFFITLGLITACIAWRSPTPISTPTPSINASQAIETAISACKTPHLVLIGEPQNIRSKLTNLEEADKFALSMGETTADYGIPMDSQVWMVQMDGQLQLVGGPLPAATNDRKMSTPTPSQPVWGTCTVVIDARSGKLIFVLN